MAIIKALAWPSPRLPHIPSVVRWAVLVAADRAGPARHGWQNGSQKANQKNLEWNHRLHLLLQVTPCMHRVILMRTVRRRKTRPRSSGAGIHCSDRSPPATAKNHLQGI